MLYGSLLLFIYFLFELLAQITLSFKEKLSNEFMKNYDMTLQRENLQDLHNK